MKRSVIMSLLILCSVSAADATTYQWTDDKGVIGFSDDLNAIPTKYRSKVKRREDITTRNPKVQQDLREQDRRVREDNLTTPRIVATPDYLPPSPPPTPTPEIRQPGGSIYPAELPPGRTKSQRIQDNIERR